MKFADETGLVGYVEKFKNDGYTENFIIDNGQLKSTTTGKVYETDKFEIDGGCQFDITENATDSQFLFTVKADDAKGIIVDLLGDFLDDESNLIEDNLTGEIEQHLVQEGPDNKKYGLQKIYKADFEQNPDRFELRIAYPDFPTCPLDQTFSMLGFDKEKDEYVWLVTSIIRDKRLARKEYVQEV